jgi:glycosyltransferase involved in cell wall biosynthesis
VADGVNGYVCDPTPASLAAAVDRLAADPGLAAGLGDRGHASVRDISWDHVVDRLIAAAHTSDAAGATA